MIHLIQNSTRTQYDSAMFDLIGGQSEELTYLQLLQRILRYVTARQLAQYDGNGNAWLDTTDTGFRNLLGLQVGTERYVMWDAGQRISGWREIVERVNALWAQGDG